ncbi:hypothetical protein H2200_008098 [Cladophialophora chaetospira]|uniref:Uncharacterized protein n=1 Tax=Cladophialophora chaetospira TaxID=386627 RepID=A0AA38X5L5_9EURO|nr:hypothetical protein H2200_008098 [Cladophialophora chaetospira]
MALQNKRLASSELKLPPAKSLCKVLRRKIVVSLDLGTTETKVAYIVTGSQNPQIKLIDHYPGESLRLGEKRQSVPTQIRYLAEPRTIDGRDLPHENHTDFDEEYDSPLDDDEFDDWPGCERRGASGIRRCWGYETWDNGASGTRSTTHHFSTPKHFLTTSQQHKTDLKEFGRLKAAGWVERPEHILADFLQFLLQHVISRLREVEQLQREDVVDFVLSLPDDYAEAETSKARHIFHKALEISRIDQNCIVGEVSKIRESSAAAHFVWKTHSSVDIQDRLVPGDSFLLLDCGGQTVDATVYEVDRLEPDQLYARVSSESALCGSRSFSEGFRKALKRKLKDHSEIVPSESLDEAVRRFEHDQKTFDIFNEYGGDTFDRIILRSNTGSTSSLQFGTALVRDMFQANFDKIQVLVNCQLERAKEQGLAVEVVIVVGGLCESPSFQLGLEEIFSKWESIRKRPVCVVFSHKATSAVVRGAIQVALAGGRELEPFNCKTRS